MCICSLQARVTKSFFIYIGKLITKLSPQSSGEKITYTGTIVCRLVCLEIKAVQYGHLTACGRLLETKSSAKPELHSTSTFHPKLLKCFSCHYEMEAVLRVSLLVMQVVDGTSATVELQPSLPKYPSFTDFAFLFKESDYLVSFIEVKNFSTSTSMQLSATNAHSISCGEVTVSRAPILHLFSMFNS